MRHNTPRTHLRSSRTSRWNSSRFSPIVPWCPQPICRDAWRDSPESLVRIIVVRSLSVTVAKRLAGLCVTLAAAGCLAALAYGFSWYTLYHDRIDALIDHASPGDRSLPAPVSGLLRTSLHGGTCSYAARLLIGELVGEPKARYGMLGWHATFGSWSILTCVHLSDEDRTTLIASLAPTGGGGRGLSATAHAMYGRPLLQLTLSEAASVVALTQNPSLRTQPARLAQSSRILLARDAAGS